jgi:hypothetical protein
VAAIGHGRTGAARLVGSGGQLNTIVSGHHWLGWKAASPLPVPDAAPRAGRAADEMPATAQRTNSSGG